MHRFRVVKERYGWAVRLGDGVCTPYWSRSQAVREANRLCEALRLHGVSADVVVDDEREMPRARIWPGASSQTVPHRQFRR